MRPSGGGRLEGGMRGVRLINDLKTHFREGETNEELIDEIVQRFWSGIQRFSVQGRPFRDCSRMREPKRSPPWNLPHISSNDETWHSYTLPKADLNDI